MASQFLAIAATVLLAGCANLPSPPSLPGSLAGASAGSVAQNSVNKSEASEPSNKISAAPPVEQAVAAIQQADTLDIVQTMAKLGVQTAEDLLSQWVKDPFYSAALQLEEEQAAQQSKEAANVSLKEPAAPSQPVMPDITVSSIVYHPKKAMAVLVVAGESQFVRVGARVAGVTVKKITPDSVVVGTQTISLPDIVGFAPASTMSPNTQADTASEPPKSTPPGLQNFLEKGPAGSNSALDGVLNGIKN